jgi:hypothetical protein
MLLNNRWVKGKITMKTTKYLKKNENTNTVKLTECSNSSAKGESLELCTELSQ